MENDFQMTCSECGNTFDVEESVDCPNCGFGPESCSHPLSERDEDFIYSVDEGSYINRSMCEKCGAPV